MRSKRLEKKRTATEPSCSPPGSVSSAPFIRKVRLGGRKSRNVRAPAAEGADSSSRIITPFAQHRRLKMPIRSIAAAIALSGVVVLAQSDPGTVDAHLAAAKAAAGQEHDHL